MGKDSEGSRPGIIGLLCRHLRLRKFAKKSQNSRFGGRHSNRATSLELCRYINPLVAVCSETASGRYSEHKGCANPPPFSVSVLYCAINIYDQHKTNWNLDGKFLRPSSLYLFHHDPFLYVVAALKVERNAAMSKLIGTSNLYKARLLTGGWGGLLGGGRCGKEVNNK